MFVRRYWTSRRIAIGQLATVKHLLSNVSTATVAMKKKTGSVIFPPAGDSVSYFGVIVLSDWGWQQKQQPYFVSSHEYIFSLGFLERYVCTAHPVVTNKSERCRGQLSLYNIQYNCSC